MSEKGWIGVDLDGTLALYDGWQGEKHIGRPIPLMIERVKRWLEQGIEVRIVTARVCRVDFPDGQEEYAVALAAIEAWCKEHVGVVLKVTHKKDFQMRELWDDRCVTVEKNTGRKLTRRSV